MAAGSRTLPRACAATPASLFALPSRRVFQLRMGLTLQILPEQSTRGRQMPRQDCHRAIEIALATRRVDLPVLVVGLVFMERYCQLQTQVALAPHVQGVDQSEQV